MSAAAPGAASCWADAARAAALFAVDPKSSGGILLRAAPGPLRDRFLSQTRDLLPAMAAWRRVPPETGDDRLVGGLDLAATLAAGRPVGAQGILAEADGGVLVLPMAERATPGFAARLGLVLDGALLTPRHGNAYVARVGVMALDEGAAPDEHPPVALSDRLAFHVALDGIGRGQPLDPACSREQVAAARSLLPRVAVPDDLARALCAAALALGVVSLRTSLQAVAAARAASALAGRDRAIEADAADAVRLVLAPRALAPAEAPPPPPPEPPPPDRDLSTLGVMDDVVLAAAEAVLPAGLLAQLQQQGARRQRIASVGKSGQQRQSARRGRAIGARRGDPRSGARLNLIETLRAAAPWQRVRRGDAAADSAADSAADPARIAVRRDDFRVTRFQQRSETATIFVVDASGSAAVQRLAEAKGAVELMLADCYARRDAVALLAFRGRGAELLLPPTRSLARAKRCLAELPGGGGTPLASGIDAAGALADAARRRGQTPVVILLTDGRANVARDGVAGRAKAEQDCAAAARAFGDTAIEALLVDTGAQPQPATRRLADAMRARYLPLPRADAPALYRAIRSGIGPAR